MPIVFSYDLQDAPPIEHNRLASMFERLGWQSLGGSSFRYPALGSSQPTEDWFNHVVPALALFRSYVLKSKRTVSKFSLDASSSTGFNPSAPGGGYGSSPALGASVTLYNPSRPDFGQANLKSALDAKIEWPY